MKRISILGMIAFTVLCAGLVYNTRSSASVLDDPILTDEFSYSVGQLTDASSGANVSGGKWVTNTGTGSFLQVSAGSLSYASYPSSGTGNKLDIISTTSSAEDTFTNFTPVTTGTTYAAFLVNVANTTGLAANSSTTGDYFAGFINSGSTTAFADRVTIRSGTAANTYQLGIRASGNAGNTQVFSAVDLPVGSTALVVISYQIVTGGTTNDVTNLWVNPTIGGSEPVATLSQTAAAEITDVGRFFIRQGNAGTPNASIDGLRVGTTWASVTGGAPTPTPSPTSGDFTNASAITINDAAVASPYPSTINVSGLVGNTTNVTVKINGFNHTFPSDVAMVLVAPNGAAFLLQDGVTNSDTTLPGDPAVNVTYTISDAGAALMPSSSGLVDGTTYKPTAYFTDEFPAPGPLTTYNVPGPNGTATFASSYGGASPNGTWNLYIADFVAGDSGSISGGWTLSVTTDGITPTPTPTPQADLSITKTDGVTTAVPGGSVTYTITASNAGPNAATGANVADTFPAALTGTWTCVGAGGGTCTASGSGNINDSVNLPSGGSVTYTVSSTISGAATGTLSNTASVTAPAGTTDPTPGNNSATDSDTLTPQADLAITKTDGVTTVTAGGSTTYTITASNAGPSSVTGATVADTFPASVTANWTCAGAGGGTCTAAGAGNINDAVNLPAGGSVTYTASATISVAATGTLSNTATVTAPVGTTDPTPGNNSATDTDTINPHVVTPAQVDMNGDGFTDFVQVRGTGSAFSGNFAAPGLKIPRFMGARGKVKYFAEHPNLVSDGAQFQEFWYVLDNQTGTPSATAWGDAGTDFNVPADYDGDGHDDIAVWRSGPAGQARFFIIRSTDGTIMAPFLGQEGDDPTVVADYDGDGIDDLAVYSCPATPGPCSFNYIGSKDNPTGSITSVSWGTGTPGSILPIAGDYDGDKKADFCVYQEDPAIPGQGQYALHKSDASPDEFVDWGLFASDIVVPGDFDHDGKTDFMVIRDTGGNYVHWLFTRTNQIFTYNWGITDDVPTPGDYDGDGKTDVAVWRPSNGVFYVINSHDGSTLGVQWGQCSTAPCDEPVADWQVH